MLLHVIHYVTACLLALFSHPDAGCWTDEMHVVHQNEKQVCTGFHGDAVAMEINIMQLKIMILILYNVWDFGKIPKFSLPNVS